MNNNSWCCRKYCESRPLLPFFLLTITLSTFSLPASAQIIPDRTLGNENSIVTPLDSLRERIDGGAIRGSNLFHSFLEFNIPEGRAAYFSNPEAIQSIFSRVTGNNPSYLLGTLGVLGNANLFFINPNGIIFGQNARLDISGSFVASTANSITFPDGSRFSATKPEGVPLLTINVPVPIGLQFEGESSGAIINQGNLVTGGNLALVGGTVVSTGQLSSPQGEITLSTVFQGSVELDKNGNFLSQESQFLTQKLETLELGELSLESGDILVVGSSNLASVQGQKATLSAANNLRLINSLIGTTGDLNLLAKDTVFISDSIETPFLAVAGKNLVIEGKQGIDIFALNHPASELISGEEMILRSPNAVIGDAHFWSGGSFQIEKLDGSLGDLSSPSDPIIRSQGDVSLGAYKGDSLHILAGGQVDIGTVIITGADTEGEAINPLTTPALANITLSDGTSLIINGKEQPTLDIRAGINLEAIGEPLGTIEENSGTFFDVFIFPFGVFFFPIAPPENNPVATSADITIGEVVIIPPDGVVLLTNQYKPNLLLTGGDITITGTGVLGIGGIDAIGFDGGGSDVILDSRNNITLTGSLIDASSLSGANGGDIKVLANEDITLESGAGIISNGLITITATDTIILSGEDSQGTISEIVSQVESGTVGDSGGIKITTGSLLLIDGTRILSSTFGKGNAGEIQIKASDDISLAGEDSQGFVSGVFSQVDSTAEGNSGGIVIDTTSLSLTDGAFISASTFGKGNAGQIQITASNGISLVGLDSRGEESGVFSGVDSTAEGNSGGIIINTTFLSLTDGARIDATTFGKGNAGAIQITASDGISLTGEDSQGRGGGVFSGVEETAKGNSGGIVINTTSLSLTDGALINVSTFGKGNAGAIQITASDGISLAGEDSQGFSSSVFSQVNSTAEGNSGGIVINTTSLSLTDGAEINAGTLGKGNAGAIQITVFDSIYLAGKNSQGFDSGVFSGVASTAEGNSGGIIIDTTFLFLTEGALISAGTLGKGNAGAIQITASDNIFLTGGDRRGGVISTVEDRAEGNSGGIVIDTAFLSLTDGAAIDASTFGKGSAGAIQITASDGVSLAGKDSQGFVSGIFSTVASTAEGNAGSIILDVPQLTLLEGTIIAASTNGRGDGGGIIINSPQSILLGKDSTLSVETTGAGKPGDINIATNTLTIGQDAQLSATSNATSTNTEGGGSITLNANQINIAGQLGIFAETQSIAPAGNLILKPYNTPNLNIQFTDNGFISASTSADGQGGNIAISAPQTLDIRGEGTIAVETSGKGNAGTIDISSQNLTLADGLEISASTTGEGNAGNINLNANQVNLSQSEINALTNSTGNAGSISLSYQGNNANQVTLTNNSQISTEIGQNGQADNPSNIDIKTDNLTLDNSIITASTQGKGDAGSISVPNAQTITLKQSEITASTSGEGDTGKINLNANQKLQLNNSNINSSVEQGAVGNSQQITLDTPNLELNTSEIAAATAGQGNAGSILIPNANTVTLDNSTISTAIAPTGVATQPSNITLNTQQLTLNNNSQINASTQGKGDAGDITIPHAQNISLNHSEITASTSGKGDTGEINLNANQKLDLTNSQINSSVEEGAIGNSRQITLNTPNLKLNTSEIAAATAGQGNAGSILIPNANTVTLDNSTISTAIAPTGNATQPSNITLNTQQLTLDNNSLITASTSGKGRGGNINLTANASNLMNGGQIRTTTAGNNDAGDINLKITENLNLTGSNTGIFADTAINSFGNGGSIFITTSVFKIQDGATVSVNSQGKGIGGNITIFSNNLLLNQGTILAQSSSNQGGNITLKIDDTLTLSNGSQISTTAGTAEAGGDGGNIDISARLILSNLYDNNDITANAFTGNGGNIQIKALTILGLAVQESLTPFSDITASSQFGLAGNITLNLASLNPTRGLENLSQETVTPEVRQVCQTLKGEDTAEFYEIGKGGLPESPDTMLNAEIEPYWIPWVKPSVPTSPQTHKYSPDGTTIPNLPCQEEAGGNQWGLVLSWAR